MSLHSGGHDGCSPDAPTGQPWAPTQAARLDLCRGDRAVVDPAGEDVSFAGVSHCIELYRIFATAVRYPPTTSDLRQVRGTQNLFDIVEESANDGVCPAGWPGICTPPSSDTLRVGIKRTPGGLFSGWAVEQLRVGDRIEVAQPTGLFHVPLDPAFVRHHVGIAGGSGIGPILSVLATTLDKEPRSRFTLLYANRTAEAVMFRAELEAMGATFGDRLRVVHVHEDVDGFIDATKLGVWLTDGTLADADAWFICGPNAMADAVNAALRTNGVDLSLVHSESYTAGETRITPTSDLAARFADAELTFTVGGSEQTVPVSGRTLLDAALSTGTEVPWSCRSGICGTCRAKLCDGTVELAFNDVLSEQELADGYILTCQSRPTSDRVAVDYDF